MGCDSQAGCQLTAPSGFAQCHQREKMGQRKDSRFTQRGREAQVSVLFPKVSDRAMNYPVSHKNIGG